MHNVTRRRFFMVGTAATLSVLGFAGCGGAGSAGGGSGSLADGTYTGQSSMLDANVDGDGYGIISVTVEGGKIVDATFEPFQVDGTPKDKDYGKDGAYYAVAQKAVSAGDEYAEELVAAGSVDGVDAVSGATYLYDQFIEAANDALSKAR